ncbi:chitin synthase-domain-containing protein [Gongronella butleri]|nr:chitin synthase-domain-containing protein [Gongronella butleri]
MNRTSRVIDVVDLTALDTVDDDAVASALKTRFDHGAIYAKINDQVMVALNPHQERQHESAQYVAAYKDTSDQVGALPPHIFQIANQAYMHMRRTGIDQSILFSGETGSGKSYGCQQLVQHLVSLSSPKKEAKLHGQVMNAQWVLAAFGHAKTAYNRDASRFGKMIEMQFNERGRLVGAKFLHYLLDKRRVARSFSGEQNFHVLYDLVGGAAADERDALRLADQPGQYRYLSNAQNIPAAIDAGDRYERLKQALRSLGIGKRLHARIMQLLAALLHLGNLQFVEDSAVQEAAFVKNRQDLELVADFLGVPPQALENALTYKTQLIKRDVTTMILHAQQASQQRDNLVTALYSLLFSWLVEKINVKLCADQVHNVIGLLDLPGPQTHYTHANFDNFCVNYATERVHGYILRQLFEHDLYDYRADGIDISDIPYFSNAGCLELLGRPKHGLLNIANHYSKSTTRNYDSNMMDAFIKYNGNHDSFATRSTDSQSRLFSIRHFDAQVVYTPDGFLDANKDVLNPDVVAMVRGDASAGIPASYNAFLVDLFESSAIRTESHPKESSAILNAQQSNKPTRLPSMRRSKSVKRNKEDVAVPQTISEKPATDDDNGGNKVTMVLDQLQSSFTDLCNMLDETIPWYIFCLRINDMNLPQPFDMQRVRAQVRAYGLAQIATRMKHGYTIAFEHAEFADRYRDIIAANQIDAGSPTDQCVAVASAYGWLSSQCAIGNTKVYLCESAWRQLEDVLRVSEKEDMRRQKEERQSMVPGMMMEPLSQPMSRLPSADALSSASFGSGADLLDTGHDERQALAANAAAIGLPTPGRRHHGAGASVYSDDQRSFVSDDEDGMIRKSHYAFQHETASMYDSERMSDSGQLAMKDMLRTPAAMQQEMDAAAAADDTEEEKPTAGRKHWVRFVWFMTWWIPSKCMVWCGRMKRKDVRLAWREKLTLCMLIFLMSGFIIWFLVFFGSLICPHQSVYSTNELQNHGDKNNAWVSIRGEVFDLTSFAPHHYPNDVIPSSAILQYGGQDVSDLFPVQVSALCQGTTGTVSDNVNLDYNVNLTDPNAHYHDFRINSDNPNPNWYYDQMTMLRKNYKLGNMGFTNSDISKQASSAVNVNGINTPRTWASLNGSVYDLTSYVLGGRTTIAAPGQTAPNNTNTNFMADAVVNLFKQNAGSDITNAWNDMALDPQVKSYQLVCLRNLFFVGLIDNRNSPQCVFSEYLLLIVTAFLCLVILFKFLAALQFGTKRDPENHDKFVICQVPCYTEDEDSLRKTIDSIAVLKYDDKRKLLFLICDGMIVGGGNDRPTPRIVLDILGVDASSDPEPLSFFSVGEGQRQHNMGKVYSGLYECHGHVVPYVVVVKVGTPSERQKPGNRGKRDSQLVLMRFLNKVHFNAAMTPMELEIFHQIKNVIGVHPSFYEFVLMVDADTEVMPDGLNRMVSCLVHDSKIIGLCGETLLSNEKDTWVTMIQVYEYFISHYMIKAFESLFSTVTCLPGCFTIYRVRTPQKNQPLLISNQVIEDYQINKVDTLHKKNLLYLGEDRYLTTLILKHFPKFKTKFIADAKCRTNAPDQWSVLVSQRRRWINSTIHNLGELVFLPQLCGFCCFSMRFVVMLDLLSTLLQPAIVGYLVYLIYSLATSQDTVPIMSIITIAGVYGLQALIFIFHRKWEYIVWMIVSILAIPVFSLYIPLYSYWHFDDFSWGNTRVVLGDKGKKTVVADEGKFDKASIPTMTWDEYEEALLSDDWQDQQGGGGGYFNDNASVISRGTAKTGYSQGTYYSQVPPYGAANPFMNPPPGNMMMAGSRAPSVYNMPSYASPSPTPYDRASQMGGMGMLGQMMMPNAMSSTPSLMMMQPPAGGPPGGSHMSFMPPMGMPNAPTPPPPISGPGSRPQSPFQHPSH